jgi:hypothetical protein
MMGTTLTALSVGVSPVPSVMLTAVMEMLKLFHIPHIALVVVQALVMTTTRTSVRGDPMATMC